MQLRGIGSIVLMRPRGMHRYIHFTIIKITKLAKTKIDSLGIDYSNHCKV